MRGGWRGGHLCRAGGRVVLDLLQRTPSTARGLAHAPPCRRVAVPIGQFQAGSTAGQARLAVGGSVFGARGGCTCVLPRQSPCCLSLPGSVRGLETDPPGGDGASATSRHHHSQRSRSLWAVTSARAGVHRVLSTCRPSTRCTGAEALHWPVGRVSEACWALAGERAAGQQASRRGQTACRRACVRACAEWYAGPAFLARAQRRCSHAFA